MYRHLLSIVFIAWNGSFLPSSALGVDLDGDGVSEIWELNFPGLNSDAVDTDGDSLTDLQEMIAGTDPTISSERLEFSQVSIDADHVELVWVGIPGKLYGVEELNLESGQWIQQTTVEPSEVLGIRSLRVERAENIQIFRLAVSDWDGDGDGVSAWEESLLGWDDGNPSTLGRGIGDFERVIRVLENPGGLRLVSGEILPRRLPEPDEASRFLMQTSFGPTMDTIEAVTKLGFTGYFDAQIQMPLDLTRPNMFLTGQSVSAALWRHGWWRTVLVADDQLRQRMAYALSQIFVVNNEAGTVIGDNALTQATYYDALLSGAFGNFRDALDHVTYSPTMGFYLSHLNNRKSNPETNRFPDENFAREVMQLFTIGLWRLNSDGTHELNDEGQSMPTYDNTVITEMAKIFTGMSHGRSLGAPATSFYNVANGNDYQHPLVVWDEEHELGEKILFNGVTIPEGQTGDEDVQQTLDALASHANVAPFISRLLIQRLTSSNPSPDYLRRVSLAWEGSGGDLEIVLRAVIFDPEARTVDIENGIRGKVREPLIRLTHIMRAFAPQLDGAKFRVSFGSLIADLGQFVMSSPSVFNFYSPDHSPSGLLAEQAMVAPELEIATTSALLGTHNLLRMTASSGHGVRGVEYDEELALVNEPEELLDRLDLLLAAGMLSESTRAAALDRINGEVADSNKVRVATQMIVISPDFSVLK